MSEIETKSEAVWQLFREGKINHAEVQKRLDKILPPEYKDCGLVGQIEAYINSLLRHRFSYKMKSTESFLSKFEQAWNDSFFKINWEQFFEKHRLEPLTEEVKANIIRLFNAMLEDLEGIKGINEYRTWMLHFDVVLSWFLYFNGYESSKTEVFQQVLEYYRFLRTEVEARGSLIPEPFNKTPLERYWQHERTEQARIRVVERKKQEILNRPACPECGAVGQQIISYGLQWCCKQCGRRWLKNPRKKH